MKRIHVILVCAAAVSVAVVFANLPGARVERMIRPKAASQSRDDVRANRVEEEQVNHGAARAEQIALAIERALVARDPRQRETAFAFLVPELVDTEPTRMIALVARQDPGETRDALRDEVVRDWIVRDRDAAVAWIGTLEDERELEAAATTAMRALAAIAPAGAIEVADQFGIGRNDGSLEHLVQIWATEKPHEAIRWLEAQPAGDPGTVQLRARIESVAAGTYNAATRNGTPSKHD